MQPSLFAGLVVERNTNPHAVDAAWYVVDPSRGPSHWTPTGAVVSVHRSEAEAASAAGTVNT